MPSKQYYDFIHGKYGDASAVQQLAMNCAYLTEDQMGELCEHMNELTAGDEEKMFYYATHFNLVAKALNSNIDRSLIDFIKENANNRPVTERAFVLGTEIKDFVLSSEDGRTGAQNQCFIQSSTVNPYKLPVCGYKLHISADSFDDYFNLCARVVPEFKKAGVPFKIVQPEMYGHFSNGNQQGKFITVYITPEINNVSKETMDYLLDASKKDTVIAPNGDMSIGGRVFERYGRFRGGSKYGHFITSPEGLPLNDPKALGQAKPEFISESEAFDALNFHSNNYQQYLQTGDVKTYYQNAYTMTQGNGYSHAYQMFEIDTSKAMIVDSVMHRNPNLDVDRYGLSFVVQDPLRNGKSLIFLHQSAYKDFEAICNVAEMNGVSREDFIKPYWAERDNFFNVPAELTQDALKIVTEVERECGNMGMVQLVQFENGSCAIKCDTSADRLLRENQLMQMRGHYMQPIQLPDETVVHKAWRVVSNQPLYSQVTNIEQLRGQQPNIDNNQGAR